jgi:hypothetical protein
VRVANPLRINRDNSVSDPNRSILQLIPVFAADRRVRAAGGTICPRGQPAEAPTIFT